MKIDIILSGVGGQGILTIATIIGYAAVEEGLYLKQAEVHGMSQRGGDVQSHLRISDKPIYSDLIPKGEADIVIAVEPMEGLRYVPFLSAEGWLVANSTPYINIPDYPDIEKLKAEITKLPHYILLDADKIAKDLGNARGMNMVVLGAASPFLQIDADKLENAIRTIFKRKGDKIVQANIDAFRAGRKFSQENR
jgi:indolepyruvate ferredoxin oxidoreductase beta subunit